MYTQEPSWDRGAGPEDLRDSAWFEEGLYKAKGNRFRQDKLAKKSDFYWFPTEEEKTQWNDPKIFNKNIIDKLEQNPEEVFKNLVDGWFEMTPEDVTDSLVKALEKYFKRGFILTDVSYEYPP